MGEGHPDPPPPETPCPSGVPRFSTHTHTRHTVSLSKPLHFDPSSNEPTVPGRWVEKEMLWSDHHENFQACQLSHEGDVYYFADEKVKSER